MMDHTSGDPAPTTAALVRAPIPDSEAGTDVLPAPRSTDLVLARAHLRLGSLSLARAELEILAGRGALDTQGHVDLAEARWRTGDLQGAGAAASIAMAAGEDLAILLAIAAETAAALGRPNEARRLAGRAMEGVQGPIDDLFAGMPRSGVWPADAAEPAPTTGTLFHHEPTTGPKRRAGDADLDVTMMRASPPDEPRDPGGATLTLGFWDPDGSDDMFANAQPDPGSELEAARAALVAGALDDATLRFGLALRFAPALAPAVLEATDGVATPAINVVRGDAFRLVGLEIEARRAYAAAAWSGAHDRRRHAEREIDDAAESAGSVDARSPEAVPDDPAPDA